MSAADQLTTEQRLRIMLLRERQARRMAQRALLAAEEQSDMRDDALLASELAMRPGDRLADDLSRIERAPKSEPTPLPKLALVADAPPAAEPQDTGT